MCRALRLLLVVAMLAPATASAGSITQRGDCNVDPKTGQQICTPFGPMTFTAAAGETNRVTLSEGPNRSEILRDAGAAIGSIPSSCERIDANAVSCADAGLSVKLEDGDDEVTISSGSFYVSGGTGNDTLTGGSGSDTLDGGPGNDRLDGGADEDTLIDGEMDAEAAADVFVGGPDGVVGGDTVQYALRESPVVIDIAAGRAAEDTLESVENAKGGAGPDTLSAGPAAATLDGSGGDDVLVGGDAADKLLGGAGEDRLDGGGGADILDTKTDDTKAAADAVACGNGTDKVDANPPDVLERDCERARLLGDSVRPQPRFVKNAAVFRFEFTRGGTVSLQGPGGALFGRVEFGDSGRARIPLTKAGRKAIARGVLVRVTGRSLGQVSGYTTRMQS